MLTLTSFQFEELDAATRKKQLDSILDTYIAEISNTDSDIGQILLARERDEVLSFFDQAYRLTKDRLQQQGLLAIWANTRLDVFNHPEFDYTLSHPFLSGESKARHILMSYRFATKET